MSVRTIYWLTRDRNDCLLKTETDYAKEVFLSSHEYFGVKQQAPRLAVYDAFLKGS